MANFNEIADRLYRVAVKTEETHDSYLEVLTSEGEIDVTLSDGKKTPNLNKRLGVELIGKADKTDLVDSKINTWSGRTQEDKNKEFVSVKDYGAVGDGVADDTAALNAAFNQGGSIFIPKGVYKVTDTLRYVSNLKIVGSSIDDTVIRMDSNTIGTKDLLTSISYVQSATNEHEDYVENLYISDLTLDGNAYNRIIPDDAGQFKGSNLLVSCSKNVVVERVKSINAVQHCFDTIASRIYNEEGVDVVGVGRSYNITFRDCQGINPRSDDAFTTHFTDKILIDNCVAYRDQGGTWTTNGFEIDDGSTEAVVSNCRAINFQSGFQAKAHDNAMPVKDVTFINCHTKACSIGYHLQSVFVSSGTIKKGSNIKAISCTNESNVTHYPTEFNHNLGIRATGNNGVVIRDYYERNSPNGGGILVDGGIDNILIDGYIGENVASIQPTSSSGSSRALIDCSSTLQGGITIRNVRLVGDIACTAIKLSNAPDNILIDSVRVQGKNSTLPAIQISYGSGVVQVSNVKSLGFLEDIQVLNGYYAGLYKQGVGNGHYSDLNIKGTLRMGSDSNDPFIRTGTGSPEGVMSGVVGSIYIRTDGSAGSTFYVKETGTGNTGWIAK